MATPQGFPRLNEPSHVDSKDLSGSPVVLVRPNDALDISKLNATMEFDQNDKLQL